MSASTVRSYFRDERQLDRAVQALTEASFAPEMIHVGIVTPARRRLGLHLIHRSGDLMGAVIGAAAGTILGMLLAVLVVQGWVTAAWLQAFFSVDTPRALFRGAVAGAAFVGLWGGIVGFGWWREEPPTHPEAKLYVLTVDTVTEAQGADHARTILKKYSSFHD